MKEGRYIVNAFLILLAASFIFFFLKTAFQNHPAREENIPVQVIDNDTTNPKLARGEKVFRPCASCHNLTQDMTGPSLAGVEQRGPWKDHNKLLQWIHNPAKFMLTDKYAQSLQRKFVVIMSSFPGMTMEDLDAMLAYINSVR